MIAPRAARWRAHLLEPVDNAWLAALRIGFGLLLAHDALGYVLFGGARRLYVDPGFHFTYFGFGWVRPWPGAGMDLHFFSLSLLGVALALGLFHRVVAPLFFLAVTYVFLLDQARYLNHAYLICLLAFLLSVLPAHRAFSIDAWRNPRVRSRGVPRLALLLMQFQIGIVYLYAGIAKLNGDWLRGEPIRTWLGDDVFPVVGRLFTNEWAVYAVAYGGLVFDLLVFPLFLLRRTRWPALAAALLFHLTNYFLFDIGVFPWLMIVATTVAFFPDVVARAAERLRPAGVPGSGFPRYGTRLVVAAALWVAFQTLVPLRHHLYPGDVAWTEEGHRFSWRMKLRGKDGWARFVVTEPVSGRTWVVDPSDHLTGRQARKMSGTPDMILQFAHHLARIHEEEGPRGVEVRARVLTSLNGAPHRLLVDPDVDLARRERTLGRAAWILPRPPAREPAGRGPGDPGVPGPRGDG